MKHTLILLTALLLLVTSSSASEKALDHANPMPNLVRYAMSNGDALELTKGQKQAIKDWASANKLKIKKLAKKVVMQEQKLLKDSLMADEDMLQKAESILDTRREIMKIKTLCRTHLKTVLTPQQYEQIIDIYIEEYYQKTEIIL